MSKNKDIDKLSIPEQVEEFEAAMELATEWLAHAAPFWNRLIQAELTPEEEKIIGDAVHNFGLVLNELKNK